MGTRAVFVSEPKVLKLFDIVPKVRHPSRQRFGMPAKSEPPFDIDAFIRKHSLEAEEHVRRAYEEGVRAGRRLQVEEEVVQRLKIAVALAEPEPVTDRSVVIEILGSQEGLNGLRSQEILQRAHDLGHTRMKENTLRSLLNKLKHAGVVTKEGHRWLLAGLPK